MSRYFGIGTMYFIHRIRNLSSRRIIKASRATKEQKEGETDDSNELEKGKGGDGEED